MRYEHFSQPLLAHNLWLRRILRSSWLALIILAVMLVTGTAGYHMIGGLGWVDAFLESSMILAGMGAVAPMTSDGVKIFASAYALLSGCVVLTTTAMILAPFVHRLLHHHYGPTQKADGHKKPGEITAAD